MSGKKRGDGSARGPAAGGAVGFGPGLRRVRLAAADSSHYTCGMHVIDILRKKRNGVSLSREEIDFVVRGYVNDTIPDYQMAALLMAVWFRGMNKEETTELTLAMARSGDQVDLSAIPGIKVDKHSTGGVADTTTLVVAPLVAACGGRVAKMSGRGLGHTGGTLDKLESIPGFSVNQTMDRFVEIVADCGLAIIGQTANLVPADKKLYSLRDVTETVDNISLIASSIMSKKIASGADAIVLDVKTGSGAFMREPRDASELARTMVDIGQLAGRRTLALVTDMNQPLGNAIGNALEVEEAIEILQGKHRGSDLTTVSFALASQMLQACGICSAEDEALARLDQALASGAALERLARMIEAEGGERRVCDDPTLLPRARRSVEVRAPGGGYIARMDTQAMGISALLLGAGREKKEDRIDPAVGIWLKKRLGDRVERDEPIATFHVNNESSLEEAIRRFSAAVAITAEKPQTLPLIYGKVE